jgi:1A family penicillin-binding protein
MLNDSGKPPSDDESNRPASARPSLTAGAAARDFWRALRRDAAALVSFIGARFKTDATRRACTTLTAIAARAGRDLFRLAAVVVRWRPQLSAGGGARTLLRPVVELLLLAACVTPLAIMIWALHDIELPSPHSVTDRRVLVLESADRHQIYNNKNFRLLPVPAQQMSPNLVNAVLSIEDRRFYQHGGIDLTSIIRAAKQNIEAGRIVGGGSTITQQLTKMLFVGPQRTFKRKIQEAAIAIWLDLRLTKNQILTSYLNDVYLGSGATGFPAAAKLYFGKTVADLSVPEAAMLAGMINAPSRDDPIHHLDTARTRAAAVLDAMVANGKLTAQAAAAAKLNPATPLPMQPAMSAAVSGGWFADWIYNRAAAAAPAGSGAVEVRTTLDLHLQNLAEQIIASTLAASGRQKHATQAALVAMRPDGAVVAMVGGRNYHDSQFNRAVQAKRQPGSSFKLFDYYAALRAGFSPEDEILDEPVDVNGWEPDNFGLRFHGEVTLAEAFAHSLNAATVRMTQQVGIDRVIAAARDLGLKAPLGNNPSLALGTSEVTLLDLTSAYAAVRAGVSPVEPWGIAGITTTGGAYAPVERPTPSQHSLGRYQGELINLLQGVVEHGTGRGAALRGFAAGKTGTSQDFRDAWFIGFNDSLVVGVWVGNDDHSPMNGVTGGSLPATIWKRFMEQAAPAPTPALVSMAPQSPLPLYNQDADAAPAPAPNTPCDIYACQQRYRSFRVSDCTYQPFSGGPRQYCERQAESGFHRFSRLNENPFRRHGRFGLFAPLVDAW